MFIIFVIIDYIVTVQYVLRYTNEFNPVVVFIYSNFVYSDIVFLGLKVIVVFMTGLLLYSVSRINKKYSNSISLVYISLAAIFAFLVIIYDILVILQVNVDFINWISVMFFAALGIL